MSSAAMSLPDSIPVCSSARSSSCAWASLRRFLSDWFPRAIAVLLPDETHARAITGTGSGKRRYLPVRTRSSGPYRGVRVDQAGAHVGGTAAAGTAGYRSGRAGEQVAGPDEVADELRVRGPHERHDTGDVRRRHRGTGERPVPAARQRGHHVHAGCDEVRLAVRTDPAPPRVARAPTGETCRLAGGVRHAHGEGVPGRRRRGPHVAAPWARVACR